MAFIAYYFHWDRDRIMDMEHRERERWCGRISDINKKLNSPEREVPLEEMI